MDASHSLAHTINQLVDVGELRAQLYRPLHALHDLWTRVSSDDVTASVPLTKMYDYSPSWRVAAAHSRERADVHDVVVFAAALLLDAARATSGDDSVRTLVIYVPADWITYVVARIEAVVRGSHIDASDRTCLQARASELLSFVDNSTSYMHVLTTSVRVEPNTHLMRDDGAHLAVYMGERKPVADKRPLSPLVAIPL